MSSSPSHLLVKLFLLAGVVTAIGVAIDFNRSGMQPIQEGDPEPFWASATHVPIGSAWPHGTTYPPRDGFLFYDNFDRLPFRVPIADVLEVFPRALPAIEAHVRAAQARDAAAQAVRAARPARLDAEAEFALDMEAAARAADDPRDPDLVEGHARWIARDPGRTDALALIECIQQAQRERLERVARDPSTALDAEKAFHKHQEWDGRFWQNLAFELAYLSAVVIFVAWPWLRGSRPLAWAIHVGLVPLLVFFPYYLGYCSLTFKNAWPSGGAFYPHVLEEFTRVHWWSASDRAMLDSLPRPLEALSQSRFLRGGPTRWSDGGYGPVTALWLGLAVGAVAFAIALVAQNGWDAERRVVIAAILASIFIEDWMDRVGVELDRSVAIAAHSLRKKCPWLWRPVPTPWDRIRSQPSRREQRSTKERRPT